MKKIIRGFSILIFLLIFVMKAENVYAAEIGTTIVTTTEITEGDKVKVTINMNSEVEFLTYGIIVNYDQSILEYVGEVNSSGAMIGGGGGTVTCSISTANEATKTKSITLEFKSKGVGSANISVAGMEGGCYSVDYEELTVKGSSVTVKVNPIPTASSDANLSSIKLSGIKNNGASIEAALSQAFNKDVTLYTSWLGTGYTKLSVTAVPADSKAKVNVTGTDLKSGTNVVVITVTAEDGTVKKYQINLYVEPETTTKPTTTEPTSKEDDTTAPPEEDKNILIKVDGVEYTVQNINNQVAIPEGFEITVVNIGGKDITAAKSIHGNLVLVYTIDDKTQTPKFYVYNEKDNTFTRYIKYTIVQRGYIILPVEETMFENANYEIGLSDVTMTVLKINDENVDAYKLKNVDNIYIVRAMNWDGDIFYYYYDSKEGSMFPFFAEEKGEDETTQSDSDSNIQQVVMTDIVEKSERDLFEKRIEKRNMLIYAMAAGMAVFAVVIMVLAVKSRKNSNTVKEETEEETAVEGSAIAAIMDEEKKNEETATENKQDISGEEIQNEQVEPEKLPDVKEEKKEEEKEEPVAEKEEEPEVIKMKEEELDKALDDLLDKMKK